MYWLLDYNLQEEVRERIINLERELSYHCIRDQQEQQFPFNGRKDRLTASKIIKYLSEENAVICDPFCGSGIFAYASLSLGRETHINEWEPYAYRLSHAPFRGIPDKKQLRQTIASIKKEVLPLMQKIYKTKCPKCGTELMFDGLFFDRKPLNYYNPTQHERMGPNGENIIFRGKKAYKCKCGCTSKKYDKFDEKVRKEISKIKVDFPEYIFIENSRINFTYPDFKYYTDIFSHRQKIALALLYNTINKYSGLIYDYLLDAFLSIVHLGKYTDYRSKSQDNHCPRNRLKETNLFYRFLEAIDTRSKYIKSHAYDLSLLTSCCLDFRAFFNKYDKSSFDLILTDPPFGDNAQYFEHAQRVHPFMKYDLKTDSDRLNKEVVISDAPIRINKHGKAQFLDDIEFLFIESSRTVKEHGFFVLYFRPQQSDWISDLNQLKHFGRKYGFEPLITIPIDNSDPSMRVLASAAWSFKKDVCFVFIKLAESERRWYVNDIDIDELIYLSALSASDKRGLPFIIDAFISELRSKLSSCGLTKLLAPKYQDKIQNILLRFCIKNNAQYILTGKSPYSLFNKEMNAEIRLREFVPIVIEELCAVNQGFTFEEYVIYLATYMENGTRDIINALHTANRLIPELLLTYAEEDSEEGKFYAKKIETTTLPDTSLRLMDPTDFEHLIAAYFIKRGFVKTEVIGRSRDRGVDILATNLDGELELIQCKRYRQGNNIGSTPIQRVDSYMRSRHAKKAWVVTTSDFTPEGIDEARITGVILINGEQLIKSLDLHFPGKYIL